MRRALARVVLAAGRALLAAAALLCLLLGAGALYASSAAGRPRVAAALVRLLDQAIDGRVELAGVELLPGGGVELEGLEVYDPDGHLVLRLPRARLSADLTRLRAQEIGLVLEVDEPALNVDTERDGSTSLARAFAPTRPATPAPAARPWRPTWTLRLTRLTIRSGRIAWRDRGGALRVAASGVDLDATGALRPAGGHLDLRVRAALEAPVAGPAALDLAARLDGDALAVPVLDLSVDGTGLAGVAEVDLARRTGRLALSRLGLAPAAIAAAAGRPALAAPLDGRLYAESDGRVVTALLELLPAGGAPRAAAGAAGPPAAAAARALAAAGGEAAIAVAVRLPPGRPAIGVDLHVAKLDPSRVIRRAPAGRIDLEARGAASGRSLADARGQVVLELARSRLGGGELGPVSFDGWMEGEGLEVGRLAARLPGLSIAGSGRWHQRGQATGVLTVEARDLGLAARNLAAATGLDLPRLGGRLRAEATLAGTGPAPHVLARLDLPDFTADGLALAGGRCALDLTGPLAALRGTATGSIDRLVAGALEVRGAALEAAVRTRQASARLTALVPALGADPVAVELAAALSPDRATAALAALTVSWPGVRWGLVAPAVVTLRGPSVDRLELADGAARIALTGGRSPRGALDARLAIDRLDLATLPRALLPEGLALAGLLSGEAHAGGTDESPELAASAAVTGGKALGMDGLALHAAAAWDGARRRLAGELHLAQQDGGTLEVRADLPAELLPSRPREPVALTVDARGWAIDQLAAAAGQDVPAAGALGLSLALSGTAGAPALAASVDLADAFWWDLGPFGLTARLAAGDGAARLDLEARREEEPLLKARATAPVELADLLRAPEEGARRLLAAPLRATVEIPGASLAPLAGEGGLPEGTGGRARATVELGGTVAAPRGTASVALDDGVIAGRTALGARIEARLEPDRTALAARVTAGGDDALRLVAALAAPVEALLRPGGFAGAALSLRATVPDLPLARLSDPDLALSGTLAGQLDLDGTPAAPRGALMAAAHGVSIDGRILGDLTAAGRLGDGRARLDLALLPAAGGRLEVAAAVTAPLGTGLDGEALSRAPATLRVTSDHLDLAFLPALAPGLIRAASGRLQVDLAGAGPLATLRPTGTVQLDGGRMAVAELGDWTDIGVDLAISDRAIELRRLAARRGRGTLDGALSLEGFDRPPAKLAGKLTFHRLELERAGMPLAELDLPVVISGGYTPDRLEAILDLPGGTVRLPPKPPRTLQSLEPRPDILVGRLPAHRRRPRAVAATPATPFVTSIRIRCPGKLRIVADNPRMDVELKSDVTFRVAGGVTLADGTVETVQGRVEPIPGRSFRIDRGRAIFSGGAPDAGRLDIVARHDGPAIVVTTRVGGTVDAPSIALSSMPPLDEASIAMYIATGRVQLKQGTSAIGALGGEDASQLALGAVTDQVFRTLVAGKLPLDQVAVDTGALRAGKYLTDRFFVGFVRRFDARPELGQNSNEVRVEYQIDSRWTLESRYGDAQSGGASLMWSWDY